MNRTRQDQIIRNIAWGADKGEEGPQTGVLGAQAAPETADTLMFLGGIFPGTFF